MIELKTVHSDEELDEFQREVTRTMIGSVRAGEPFAVTIYAPDAETPLITGPGKLSGKQITATLRNMTSEPLIARYMELYVPNFDIPINIAHTQEFTVLTPSVMGEMAETVTLVPGQEMVLTADLEELQKAHELPFN